MRTPARRARDFAAALRAAGGEVRRFGSEAEGVVVDPVSGLAAVSFRDPNRIELIDVATGRTVKRIATRDPARHLSLAAPGGPVLAPIEYRDELLRIELPSGRASSGAVGDFPHDAAEAADGRIFVSDEGGDTISVVDGDSVEIALPSPEQPGGIAAAGDTVAVVAVAAREIAFIDAARCSGSRRSRAARGRATSSPDPTTARTASTSRTPGAMLCSSTREATDPRLLDRANVPGSPYGIAVDERREHLWVTQTARNRVVEMKVTDIAPQIIASYPTVRQPNSVAVDGRAPGHRRRQGLRRRPDIRSRQGGEGVVSRLERLGKRISEANEVADPARTRRRMPARSGATSGAARCVAAG